MESLSNVFLYTTHEAAYKTYSDFEFSGVCVGSYGHDVSWMTPSNEWGRGKNKLIFMMNF